MFRYVPDASATWLALVHAPLALVVRAANDSDVDRYFSAVVTGDIRGVLDALAIDGLSATPEFALVESTGARLHLIVRGAGVVSVTTNDGTTVEASGDGIATWSERIVTDAASFSVRAQSGDATSGTLPVSSGVVRASVLVSGVAPSVPALPVIEAPAAEPGKSALSTNSATEAENTIVDRSTAGAYGHLFEETIVRSVADAAITPPSDEPVSDEPASDEPQTQPDDATLLPPPPQLGDHDGETVVSASVSKLLAGRKRVTADDAPPPPPAPVVYLDLSTGGRETLDQPVIFGRGPSVSKVSGANIPKLVTISGDDDISRNHVQFALEGGTVVVTDLHSRNGTVVVAPGKAPQSLRPGEQTSVLVGTVVDLGNGTTITIGQD